jgi:hypothetical protein
MRKYPAPPKTPSFEDALTGLQIECGQLTTALRQGQREDAKIAAREAVRLYLVAKAALRRLEACPSKTAEDLCTSSLKLSDARKALEQRFEQALEQIGDPSLHWLLRQLSLSLALANGEPPSKDPSSR